MLPTFPLPQAPYVSPMPGLAHAFDPERKAQFLALYKAKGLRCKATCNDLGLSFHTFQHHYRVDPEFRQNIDTIQAEYAEELQAKSMQYAMEPKHFMDRCMQLRRLLPDQYAPEKSFGPMKIDVIIDGAVLESSKKREQILEAQVMASTQEEK